VFVLVQVAELVVDGQAPLTRPRQRLGPPALDDPEPRARRRDRPNLWREVTDVQALRLIEQTERSDQIPLRRTDT
jgi:hypothetical protein